jgi:hypothetical protein
MTDTCRWFQEGEGGCYYNTECNQIFVVNEDCDPPLGAWMKYCCYCGKPLQEVPWEPEPGENDDE